MLRPSQRAFGTYLCVYREEDDHTTPDRKSSGWMILSAMWLRRTVSPQPLSGSRTADSFFSFFMPSGSKSASLRMVTQRRTFFVCTLCIFFCLSAGDIHYRRISPIYIHPFLYTTPHRIQLFFLFTYFLPQHRWLPSFFLHRSAGPPPALPLHTPNDPALLSPAMFRPSSRYTYSCPSPRPLSGIYAASESLPF